MSHRDRQHPARSSENDRFCCAWHIPPPCLTSSVLFTCASSLGRARFRSCYQPPTTGSTISRSAQDSNVYPSSTHGFDAGADEGYHPSLRSGLAESHSRSLVSHPRWERNAENTERTTKTPKRTRSCTMGATEAILHGRSATALC